VSELVLDVRIHEINVGVDFLVPAEDRTYSQISHALPPSIGVTDDTRHNSTVFYRSTGSAYFKTFKDEINDSFRGLGWARSPSEWTIFIRDLAPALADIYNVSEHPKQYLRSVTCECQLGNHNYELDLCRFDQLLRSSNYIVKESNRYKLSIEAGLVDIELSSGGKVALKGLNGRAQIYSLIQLLDAIRLAIEFQDYFQGKGKNEGIYPGVRFRIEACRIPIGEISPTQDNVDIRGVRYYRELLKEAAHLRVVVCIAHVGGDVRYVLLDGHHRARACFEEQLSHIDALILRPSSFIEMKKAGAATIANLAYRSSQVAN
jgi:hypothetical protein